MTKSKFLFLALMLIVFTAGGCKSTDISNTNESNYTDDNIVATSTPTPISTSTTEQLVMVESTVDTIDYQLIDEDFISSKDNISLNLNFAVYAYSEGIWGDGSYDCISISINDFGVDYYEVGLDGKIYTAIEGQLYLNEKYLNTIIKEFSIRSYDWNDTLIDESYYKNVMFFSPNISTQLDDILDLKDELVHLWIVGPEYNRHDEFSSKVNTSKLNEFIYLETLSLSRNVEYTELDVNDIGNLHRLHTLNTGDYLSDLSFLTRLPYLTDLKLWLGENYEYKNIGNINSLQKLSITSFSVYKVSLLDNFPNLEILEIRSSSLQNLYNIADLTMLEKLILIGTDNLINESFKSAPPKLSKLILFSIERPDYSFLELFNNVEELRIIDTDIVDLSFLELYDNLTIFDLNRSYSSLHYKKNIDYIKENVNFTTLILPIDYYNYCEMCNGGTNMEQGQKLTDTSFLENLDKLEELAIDIGNVEDFSEIMALDSLSNLVLANVSDISMFEGNLHNLKSLTMLNTSIADFSSIEHLKDLKQFHIYENYVYDLEGKYNFEYEFDFSFLNELTKLKYIRLYNFDMYYKISDDKFPDLDNLEHLIVLDLGSLECAEISGLFKASNVETIILEECIFSDLDGIEYLSNLNVLDLSWTDIDEKAVDAIKLIFGDELILIE